ESNRDVKKGISAVCIVKNGTLEKGMFVVSGQSMAPVRIMENFLGTQIQTATFSNPIKIIGWDSLPEVGNSFHSFKTRDEAMAQIEKEKNNPHKEAKSNDTNSSAFAIPVIIKADTGG